MNNPPPGIEGRLYAEIARTKPAPQGICTANSSGKVLSWALSFDDRSSIVDFLDHVRDRYKEFPDDKRPVTAERYMRFPSNKLSDIADSQVALNVPAQHAPGERCLGKSGVEPGTLVGRIIGRTLDSSGVPIADTTRQENYMEARVQIPAAQQQEFANAARKSAGDSFRVPDAFARSLIYPAFLGQLDVDPSGSVPGSRNEHREWTLNAKRIDADDSDVLTIHITGQSVMEGTAGQTGRMTDGRMWKHRVSLRWQGYADVKGDRLIRLSMIADGDEQLRWGNPALFMTLEPESAHLMAGHAIDLDSRVRYGLLAEQADEDEIDANRQAGDPMQRIRTKMQQLQSGVARWQKNGRDPSKVISPMKNLGPLIEQREFEKAERLIDEALELLNK